MNRAPQSVEIGIIQVHTSRPLFLGCLLRALPILGNARHEPPCSDNRSPLKINARIY